MDTVSVEADEEPQWQDIPLHKEDKLLLESYYTEGKKYQLTINKLTEMIMQYQRQLLQNEGAKEAIAALIERTFNQFEGKYGLDGNSYELDRENWTLKRKE